MGQKLTPIGFRLGIVKDWQARWFAAKQTAYRGLVFEDIQVRDRIAENYPDAGISRVEIERSNNDVTGDNPHREAGNSDRSRWPARRRAPQGP